MKPFRDNAGRTWTLDMTLDSVKRVKSLLGVNLFELELGDPPLITRIGSNEILLCDIIFCMVKPQADLQNVSDEDFGKAMGGDAICGAQNAFYEELVDFFQKRGRVEIARAVKTQLRMITLAIARMELKLSKIDEEAKVSEILGD